jgi:hypothetical protein
MHLTPEQLATAATTPSDCLRSLAQESVALARLVASNPAAEAELLKELATHRDRDTRRNVAANPNTPTAALLTLAEMFPNEFLQNPAFPLLLLEQPNLVERIPRGVLVQLLQHEAVPESFLKWAATKTIGSHGDQELQLLVAAHDQTPTDVLNSLKESPYPQVQEAAQRHLNWDNAPKEQWREVAEDAIRAMKFSVPDTIMEDCQRYRRFLNRPGALPKFLFYQLATYHESFVKGLIAENPNTPVEVLEQLCHDSNAFIPHCVARNPNIPATIVQLLLNSEVSHYIDCMCALSQNAHTPIEKLKHWSTSWEIRLRNGVAQNPNTPVSVLLEMAKSVESLATRHPNFPLARLEELIATYLKSPSNRLFHRHIAENPRTPGHWLEKLNLQGDKVAEAIAKHPNAAPKLLTQLAQSDELKIWTNAIQHPNLPHSTRQKLLENFSQSADMRRRRGIATLPITPVRLIEKLATDPELYVRRAVAKNPNTPPEILARYIRENDPNVLPDVAENPNIPIYLLDVLMQSKHSDLPIFIAHNPNTPTPYLEQLAQHSEVRVRRQVAKNPNTPVAVLEQLVFDSHSEVRLEIAANPNVPPPLFLAVMLNLRFDKRPFLMRWIALWHPETFAPALAANWRSSIWQERYAIAHHPNLPSEILQALLQDGNWLVRAAAKANLEKRSETNG